MFIAVDAHTLDFKIKAGIYFSTYRLIQNMSLVDNINKYTILGKNSTLTGINTEENQFILKDLSLPSLNLFNMDFSIPLIWLPFVLPTQLIKYKPDVLFSPTPVLPLLCPCKAVIKVHDLASLKKQNYYDSRTKLSFMFATYAAVRRADKIIAISQFTKDELINLMHVHPDKIAVVHASYDSSLFHRQDNDEQIASIKYKYKIEGRYILYFGTLEPRKNIPKLIEAFAHLKKQGNFDYKLVIAGSKGWLYKQIYDAVTSNGLQSEIIFPGYIRSEELPSLISGAVATVFVSTYEGFGSPPVEAMACGTPVITSNISSMPEIVGDAALLVNPHDTAEIARTIRLVVENEYLRKSLSQKGINRVKLYLPEIEARKTVEILTNFER